MNSRRSWSAVALNTARLARWIGGAALCLSASATPARARLASPPRTPLAHASQGWLDPHRPLTETTWVTHYLLENQRVALEDDAMRVALDSYQRPWIAGLPDWLWFERGRYGASAWKPQRALSWDATACAEDSAAMNDFPTLPSEGYAFDASEASWELKEPAEIRLSHAWLSLTSAPEPQALQIERAALCPKYRTPPSVTLIRNDGEHDRFRLLECDGSVSADSLDRFSILMRPLGVARPEAPLPVEPTAERPDEWVDGVKLVHPRLLWAVQRIAQAFPWRAVYIVSGYRRESHGYHPRGRALDLFVHGVDNVALFNFCRTLNDVGCGYYPNNSFVHVDVREYGSQHPQWVDIAEPGQPSIYVDEFQGVGQVRSTWGVNH